MIQFGSRGLLTSGLATLACTASEISLTADFPESVLSVAILCLTKNHADSISEHVFITNFLVGHAPRLH